MNFKIIPVILLFSLFPTFSVYACSCSVEIPTFCQSNADNSIVARVRQISYAVFEVLHVFSDDIIPDTISLSSSIQNTCAKDALELPNATEYIFNLRPDNLEAPIPRYFLSVCRKDHLQIQNDTVYGNISPCIVAMSYNDFLAYFHECRDMGALVVDGTIYQWKLPDEGVTGLKFHIGGDTIMTNENGYFKCGSASLNDIEPHQQGMQDADYFIEARSDFSLTHQVTIKDLIKIQKVILNIESFYTPEQYLAADVNNNQLIDLGDIILLRKAILGQIQAFPDKESWEFIIRPDGYFNSYDPFDSEWVSFVGAYFNYIGNYPGDLLVSADFTAIKIGDVTGD